MNSPPTYPARIRRLLQTHTVMTVDQLRQALHGRSRSSVFRDLKQLQVITSYSHTGRYHALQGAARFDPHGLWFFNDIGFARYGTLKTTLVQLIAQAQDGFTHKELKSRLRVAVQNALTDLVMSHTVGRHVGESVAGGGTKCLDGLGDVPHGGARPLPNGRALYISAHDAQGEAQWRRRVSRVECAAETALPSQHTRIEILVELIRASPARADEQVLGAALRARGIAVDDREVMAVLLYYDIKKNGV